MTLIDRIKENDKIIEEKLGIKIEDFSYLHTQTGKRTDVIEIRYK